MSGSPLQYVVVGGGIAGVTCVETLSFLDKASQVILISASPLIKTVCNFVQVTRYAETFDVEEHPLAEAGQGCPNVEVIHTAVQSLCAKEKKISTSNGRILHYDKLCICTGGTPKVISKDNPYVLGIRDTESVKAFQKKIATARRIVLVGNGGIATELVYELEGVEVIWAIKDKSIAHTFVDAGAGEFFLEHLNKGKQVDSSALSKRLKYTEESSTTQSHSEAGVMGGALGPDWASNLFMKGSHSASRRVHVEREVEVANILTPDEFQSCHVQESQPDWDACHQSSEKQDWPVYISLSNQNIFGCDLIVSATGVVPYSKPFLDGNDLKIDQDGGLLVNYKMETSEKDVFAAGDVCTVNWNHSPHWFQMRLWSQARQMGCYAAKCLVASANNHDISPDFCFELYTHITNFFNFKVVLLGKFNAQGLGNDYEILLRCTKGSEYVKVILKDGRMSGAVLIGETDLEETFENVILNGLDLTPFKENLLDPEIDLEDFFD